jgi:diacylglycerol kinase (ATP)
MPGIGVINNPYSRRNRKNPLGMQTLGFIVGTSGEAVATRKLEDIEQILQFFAEKQIDVLAINGGDGSNSHVLTSLIRVWGNEKLPRVALLRGGTMNIAANSCGIRGSTAGLMMNLVRKVREGIPLQTTTRHLLEGEGRYGFIFGNGFVYTFLEELYGSGNKSPFNTAKLLGRAVGSALIKGKLYRRLFEKVRCSVTVDGKRWRQKSFSALLASTVEQIGLGFKPFTRCREQPDTFHFVGVVVPAAKLVGSLPGVYFGRPISGKKIVEALARQVVLESPEPLPYTLDGENYPGSRRLKINVGPLLEIVVS